MDGWMDVSVISGLCLVQVLSSTLWVTLLVEYVRVFNFIFSEELTSHMPCVSAEHCCRFGRNEMQLNKR